MGIRLTATLVGDETGSNVFSVNTASLRSSKKPGIGSYIGRTTRPPAHLRDWKNTMASYCSIPGNPGCALHERNLTFPLTTTTAFLVAAIGSFTVTG